MMKAIFKQCKICQQEEMDCLIVSFFVDIHVFCNERWKNSKVDFYPMSGDISL